MHAIKSAGVRQKLHTHGCRVIFVSLWRSNEIMTMDYDTYSFYSKMHQKSYRIRVISSKVERDSYVVVFISYKCRYIS